jgi:hypothetical protein
MKSELSLINVFGPYVAALNALTHQIVEELLPDLQLPVPGVIVLPNVMRPYNRSIGYYDPQVNVIALFGIGVSNRNLIHSRGDGIHFDRKSAVETVLHELAHWLQDNAIGECGGPTVNIHRTRGWKLACKMLTDAILVREGKQPTAWDFWSGMKSVRVEGKVRKEKREGALSDVDLHHWPHSVANLTGGYVERAAEVLRVSA